MNPAFRRDAIVSWLTSLPKIFDSSLLLTGWKYPTAVSTIDSRRDKGKPAIVSVLPATADMRDLVGSASQIDRQIINQQLDAAILADHSPQCFATDGFGRGKNPGLSQIFLVNRVLTIIGEIPVPDVVERTDDS